jgi:hypothetical protein
MADIQDLASAVKSGDRAALPRAITLVESTANSDRFHADYCWLLPLDLARRCGVTQHVSKPTNRLNRSSQTIVDPGPINPGLGSGRHRFVIQRSTPNSYYRNDFRDADRHRLVGVDRTSATTSPPPA